MESIAVKNKISSSALPDKPDTAPDLPRRPAVAADAETVAYQLGAWLSGLESFIEAGNVSLKDKASNSRSQNYLKDLSIVRAALLRCSHLCFLLVKALSEGNRGLAVSYGDMQSFSAQLAKPILVADGLVKGESVGSAEMDAWSSMALESFRNHSAFTTLVALADAAEVKFLPEKLRRLVEDGNGTLGLTRELEVILPRFGKILRLLDIVGEMLERDEPLKPALLIFSKVKEQTQDLVNYLNQRLSRSEDETNEFLSVIDAASYTASIELKKVVQQELAGIPMLRPATSIYARTETSYALLTESFQQILAQFARQIDPTVDIFDLFPNFRNKLEQSIILRDEIHSISKIARIAEATTDEANIAKLNRTLIQFREKTVRFLFYKDIETVERFVEEILVTRQKTDLVPIIHRFGAYLETLLAQVNMRAVLEKHPFEKN